MKAAHVLSFESAGFAGNFTGVHSRGPLSRLKHATCGASPRRGTDCAAVVRDGESPLTAGKLAVATIAHEIRQPLTAIMTSADAGLRFLDRETPDLDKAKAAFRRIIADGRRADAVVEGIRSNWRTDASDSMTLDINGLIENALSVECANLQDRGIVVEAALKSRLPCVRGKPVPLQQVLLNLFSNAVDAMQCQGWPRVLRVGSDTHHGDIVVSVADTGPGVQRDDVERMFAPLFTTKPRGMGMGLAICRAILEAHAGRLWYEPNAPRGAVFSFMLRGA